MHFNPAVIAFLWSPMLVCFSLGPRFYDDFATYRSHELVQLLPTSGHAALKLRRELPPLAPLDLMRRSLNPASVWQKKTALFFVGEPTKKVPHNWAKCAKNAHPMALVVLRTCMGQSAELQHHICGICGICHANKSDRLRHPRIMQMRHWPLQTSGLHIQAGARERVNLQPVNLR